VRDRLNTKRRRLPMVKIGRGGETVGGAYYFLDLTALGRQEDWEEDSAEESQSERHAGDPEVLIVCDDRAAAGRTPESL
jgi:predicted dithiol-disulfide oxidoreductase (DUF899 family)